MLKLVVFFLICDSVLSYSIPSYVHLCKRNDSNLSQCIINSVYQIKPYLKKGITEMNLPAMEPLQLDNITINNNELSTLDLDLYNGTVQNASNFKIIQLDLDLDKAKCVVKTFFPTLNLTSKYKIKGKLMIFDLDGTGNLTFNLENVTANTEWYGTYYTKGGKQYLKFDKGNLTSQVGKATIQIDNLFKNNKVLTENFNEVINVNMDMLSMEFSPVIDQTINSLAMKYFNYVFDVFPIDVLFSRE